jgi:hypothetical protein
MSRIIPKRSQHVNRSQKDSEWPDNPEQAAPGKRLVDGKLVTPDTQ